MPIWLSRTIPMSKYFSGSRPLRHNEVQLYLNYYIYQNLIGLSFVSDINENKFDNTNYINILKK